MSEILRMCEEYSEHPDICELVMKHLLEYVQNEDDFREAVQNICLPACENSTISNNT